MLSAHAQPRRAPRSAPCLWRYRRSAGDGPKGQGRENAAPKRLTRRAERGEQDDSTTRAQRRGHLTRPEPAAALHLPTLDTRGRRGSTRQPRRNQPAAEAGRCWLPPSCGRGTTNPNRLRSRAELPAGASRQPCGTPHRPTSATPCGSPGVRSVGGALRWRRVGTGASFPQGFLAVLGARGPQAGSAAPAAGEAGRAGEGGEGAAAALAGA